MEQVFNYHLVTWSSEDEPELVAQGNSISEEGEGLTVTNKLFFEAIDKRTNPVNVSYNKGSPEAKNLGPITLKIILVHLLWCQSSW